MQWTPPFDVPGIYYPVYWCVFGLNGEPFSKETRTIHNVGYVDIQNVAESPYKAIIIVANDKLGVNC